jgi:putative aldouronate transport system permease protein
MWYILVASFSDYTLLNAVKGLVVIPVHFNLSAYTAVFRDPMILRSYLNTLGYVCLGIVINMIMTANGAYILSRKKFFWHKFLSFMVIFTMFFQGGLIPSFLLVRSLRLYNTIWAVLLPLAINTWNMLIMRNSFEAIPESIVESAKIDGANDLTILIRIILPMSKAILAVIFLYYLVARWNGWYEYMIYIQKRERFPLQLILREILIANQMDTSGALSYGDTYDIQEVIKYAAIVIATIPVLVIYPVLQKFFVKGIMVGAVKE